MYGYIYKTTNLINNKIYIGQHKALKFNPNYKGSEKLIRRAFNEYGKENFKVELLEFCETQELMDEKEIYYIQIFNSRDLDIGYNIGQGGQKRFFTGQKHTTESKEKMSEKAKCREHPPTTAGRISVTNGIPGENHMINISDLDYWLTQGYWQGKTMSGKQAWNKGLTKETDDRVTKYTESRNKHFENGESIGCFGIKGNTNGFVKGNTPWNKGTHETTHNLSLKRKNNNK